MKITNYYIVILLGILLLFSFGVGILYSVRTKESSEKKEKTAKITSTVPDPVTMPEPPSEIIVQEDPKQTEEPFSVEEILAYVIDWAKAKADDAIIEFLKEECPKTKIAEIVSRIIEEKISEISREGELHILLELANHFKDDKAVQNRLFDILLNDKTLTHQEPPLLTIAVKKGQQAIIPDLIAWNQKNIEKIITDLGKEALLYSAKNDDTKDLKMLHNNGVKITEEMASKLLLELVKANKTSQALPFLIEQNANPDYYDNNTDLTLLMHAIKNENIEMVRDLITFGADIRKGSKDKKIGYPLQIAREVGNLDIELLLREKGAKD